MSIIFTHHFLAVSYCFIAGMQSLMDFDRVNQGENQYTLKKDISAPNRPKKIISPSVSCPSNDPNSFGKFILNQSLKKSLKNGTSDNETNHILILDRMNANQNQQNHIQSSKGEIYLDHVGYPLSKDFFCPNCNQPILDEISDSHYSVVVPCDACWTDGPFSWKNLCCLPKRLTLSYIDGTDEGVCYGTDYSTVGLLLASDYCVGQILPMADLRFHYFNYDLCAFNVGIAGRYIFENDCFCQIFGLNAFYDYRQGFIDDFHLLGLGVEFLGRCWDFRANVTFPFGSSVHEKACRFDDYEGGYYSVRTDKEFLFHSFNAEIGYYLLDTCNVLLYLAAGPYYWGSGCYHARGGRIRFRPQYRDFLALDLSVSYDTIFKTVFQAQLIIYFPLYEYFCPQNKSCCFSDRQIYQPIERFPVSPIGKQRCWESNF